MPRPKKTQTTETQTEVKEQGQQYTIWDIEWTDYVLSLLSEDEKIQGNPTTDGLRRVFEKALNCVLVESTSDVVQSPCPTNEKRATVVHSLSYILKDIPQDSPFNTITVNGAADVYWGNCDKVFRNHPVAVAETRAEGRALRRALRLRKVLAAEEVVDSTEDDIGADNVTKITNNQINFIDVIAKRLDINVLSIIKNLGINEDNVKNILHEDALRVIRELSSYQQKVDDIPEDIKGYVNNWSLL
jgi:hypothetical protein